MNERIETLYIGKNKKAVSHAYKLTRGMSCIG